MRQIKKVQKHGLKFDSKLELFFYELLVEAKIPFEFQVCYELIPSFKYNGKSVRSMTLTVDFDFTGKGKNIIIDTKGFWREQNKMKWKILQWQFSDTESPIMIFPKNQKECIECINILKNM